jgi:hypothetical protein
VTHEVTTVTHEVTTVTLITMRAHNAPAPCTGTIIPGRCLSLLLFCHAHQSNMADMDIDTPAESALAPTKSKAKEDSKDGKKRFEVKKVRRPVDIRGY